MAPDVREVFDLLEFENILQAYTDSDLAVASFGPIVPANVEPPAPQGSAGNSEFGSEDRMELQRSEKILSDESEREEGQKQLEALRRYFQIPEEDLMASSYSDLLESG